ncbi:hypothetical protein A2U01_0056908, partial [Trifolium medium]|nr:hypothetical protein [Trifolium medium]
YTWVTSVGAHWEKIKAEYNAEWLKLAYLDGLGYTVWDGIEVTVKVGKSSIFPMMGNALLTSYNNV